MARTSIPGSSSLTVGISSSLETALRERCRLTNETPDHVVQEALARFLEVEHHTLFQVSTATALVQGVYQGCVTVEKIREHGNFGLGTYDSLDGEGLMLDGRVWHARGDGSVAEAAAGETAPFWVSADFQADRTATFASVDGWDGLCTQLDGLRLSPNLFAAIRIDGTFERVSYRVACKTAAGTDLVAATSHQAEFGLNAVTGTLLGFWSPSYARNFNVPGYHLHFLSQDRRHGGHVLGVRGRDLSVQVMDADKLTVALPHSGAFLKADLSQDPTAALSKAEGAAVKPS